MGWPRWFGMGRTRDERQRDIEREIRAHIDLEAEERREAGFSANDARNIATRVFGNRTLVSEEVRAIWGAPGLDALQQDVRYAVRTIRRAPGFATIAGGSAALGIGACSVLFAVLNFALFKPLPVDDPKHLLSLSESDRRTGEIGNELSYPDFRDLQAVRAFEEVAAFDPLIAASIEAGGEPQRHWGSLVTANYFAVVRPRFALGRGFDPARDDSRGAPPVVVLSHELWQWRFHGDPGVVDRTIFINRRPATVIGVTAAGFRGTQVGFVSEFWIPFSMLDEVEARQGPVSQNRRRHWLAAVARLRDGVEMQTARAELDVTAATLNAAAAVSNAARAFHLERAGLIDPRLRRLGTTLFAGFWCAAVLILLTSCSNVANLLVGRASARRREVAARMALGASRGRLIRQLLTESLVLALIGGTGGWFVTVYGARLIGFLRIPLGWPLDLSISLDYRVVLFCFALSILTGIVFGLVPALRATRADVVSDLKIDGRQTTGAGRFGLRNGLVVTQVAICTILLLGTGLFVRSLAAARRIDVGLRNRNLLLLAFDPGLDRRPDAQARQLLRDILERVETVPGVQSATLTTSVPLTLIMNNSNFVPEERRADPKSPRIRTDIYTVGPRFFETLGVSVLAGSDFRDDRNDKWKSAIVNEAFARAAFGGEPSIGRRLVGDGKQLQIVGIVATVSSRAVGEPPRPSIYLPILTGYSAAQSTQGVTLIVRGTDAALTYAGPIREVIRRVDPSLAVFGVRTMESHIGDALIVPRLVGELSLVAGSVGLVLATIGLYGVISFAITRRRKELGIRLAVGARPREILVMILRQGMTLAAIGVVLGLFAGFGATRFAASLLYGVHPTDAATFVAVPAFLIVVAVLACLLPAWRAASVDPVAVLRTE
jgi:predicted permease